MCFNGWICVYVLLKDRLDAFQYKGENDMR